MPAFLYGWALLLVIQSGGMAAVAITFARYFLELGHLPLPDGAVAVVALAVLTAINCLGVRAGQQRPERADAAQDRRDRRAHRGRPAGRRAGERRRAASCRRARGHARGVGAALTPVMFAYGGWQTASFVAGEMRDPRRDLARGLLFGVIGVIALYIARDLRLRARARPRRAGRDDARRRRR